MANPLKGEVSFSADGKEHILSYSANALCELEDRLDTSIIALSKDLAAAAAHPEKARLGLIRTVFWAGLIDHQPGIDVKEAGKLVMAVGGIMQAMNLISEAFARAFPQAETKGTRPTRGTAKAGTG